ncbi:cyclic nucleotide-binding domain-containing protein [Lacrimispora sp.]|uniref:cyclic nucleotide-binding domain-containing protein n=1 Tax=Lacrimispora sp. TaxID=2719234 RepID=UPI0039E46B8B
MDKLAEYGLQNIPLEACSCLRFSSGEEVLREGTPIFWLFLVVDGRAKICRTAPNGKSLIICYYISSGMIGEVELMTRQENAVSSVIAITDFECIVINYQNCLTELKTNILFLNRLGIELAEKLHESTESFTSSALYTGEQRLCTYILQNSHHGLFNDILTDVSCSVGMSYRHMFRLLGQLCEDGVLDKRESGYYILNRRELMRRSHTAEDSPDIVK